MNLSSNKGGGIESQGIQSDTNEFRELASDLPLQILMIETFIDLGGVLKLKTSERERERGREGERGRDLRQAVSQIDHREFIDTLKSWLTKTCFNLSRCRDRLEQDQEMIDHQEPQMSHHHNLSGP
jgi:hypothetical protein